MDKRIERMSKFWKVLPNLLLLIVSAFPLTSCIGIDASAKIDAKGAGTLSIEYQISKDFAQLGSLESTPMLPLPLSREDIERGLQGVQGVTLKSYSKSERGDNIIVSLMLAFDSPSSLAVYLDPNGKLAQYQQENGRSHLKLSFGDTVQPLDPQMKAEISEKLKPYRFKFALEAPGAAPEISVKNGDFFQVTTSGKKTTLECSMTDIITCDRVPEIDITWQ
ncbi:conserved exported hypothetical protein [uncultured spirochete]|jgi:hypothetical protein|uniref:Ig-like domain-containing protein n=1 Tax=uncultured spirochete TaxID=156406 RepID=A0A3P3XTJ7_9SPIR|nr:conserved exported hypothetical protein [uncultured spirochete]